MAKPAGPICNLDCAYCFYLEKEQLYPATSNFAMPDDVLEVFVRDYINQRSERVSFAWQGGEPTLRGLSFFKRVVVLQQKYASGRTIENALQTNGILLDDEWCEFLANHEFLVGLSVDGPEDLHDRYRVDRGGRPTFGRVMQALECLKRHHVAFNTLTTVHRANVDHPTAVYRFLKEIGSRFLQFIPIVERITPVRLSERLPLARPHTALDAQVSLWSVDPDAFGAFLCTIFDEWVRCDVGRTFVQQFDVALESWCGVPESLCLFAETCGRAVALEHNGDVYSCDHYVYGEHRLGNLLNERLTDLVDSTEQAHFGAAKRDTLPVECRECDVRFACHGECPKNRFVQSRDGSYSLNFLCAAYKRFFHHINPEMRFMANQVRHGRPPADVMRWIETRDAAQGAQVGRNSKCPCGSGRKWKHCCRRRPTAAAGRSV